MDQRTNRHNNLIQNTDGALYIDFRRSTTTENHRVDGCPDGEPGVSLGLHKDNVWFVFLGCRGGEYGAEPVS